MVLELERGGWAIIPALATTANPSAVQLGPVLRRAAFEPSLAPAAASGSWSIPSPVGFEFVPAPSPTQLSPPVHIRLAGCFVWSHRRSIGYGVAVIELPFLVPDFPRLIYYSTW